MSYCALAYYKLSQLHRYLDYSNLNQGFLINFNFSNFQISSLELRILVHNGLKLNYQTFVIFSELSTDSCRFIHQMYF